MRDQRIYSFYVYAVLQLARARAVLIRLRAAGLFLVLC